MKKTIVALCALLIAGCAAQGPGAKPGASPAPKPAAPVKAAVPLTPVTLTDFKLAGNLSGDLADFTLTATAHVEDKPGRHAGFALRPGGADRHRGASERTYPRRARSLHPGL